MKLLFKKKKEIMSRFPPLICVCIYIYRSVGIARGPSTSSTDPTNLLTQTFVDSEREGKYRLHRDPTAVYNLLALPLALTWLAFFALATSPWYDYFFNKFFFFLLNIKSKLCYLISVSFFRNPVYVVFFPVIAGLLLLVVVGVADTWENCVGSHVTNTRLMSWTLRLATSINNYVFN